jgi:hypothetical protein
MRSNFRRKVAYMGMALALFVVILFVREPIRQTRAAYKLSDDTLGDVDPTSSTMVLVLGGLRGVASNLLWTQALEMQKEQDWTNLEVVVKSIVKLEPHFISIWTFQGWNLAYNVSVEWDQVSDKYYWIKQGIKFLRNGTEVNENSPELRWDTGWTYFHKIGRADEAALLRAIYKGDDKPEIDAQGREHPAFNPDEILVRDNPVDELIHYGAGSVDNYQASLGWFQKAVNKCNQLNIRPKRMGEVAFRSYPAHAQINHAQSEEEQGNFGEKTVQREWLDALGLLRDFADYEYLYLDGKKTKLDYPAEIFSDLYRSVTLMTRAQSFQDYLAKDWTKIEARELVEQTKLVWPEQKAGDIEDLKPDALAQMKADWAKGVWEMIARDTPTMLSYFGQPTVAVLPEPAAESLASTQKNFEKVKSLDPAKLAVDGADGESARRQLNEFLDPAIKLGRFCHEELYWCDRYASMINYRYWKERTVAESETDTITARRHFFTGLERFRDGDLEVAKQELDDGLKLWRGVLDKFPRVHDDDLTAEDTVKVVKAFQAVCQQLDLDVPQRSLPFQEYLRKYSMPELSPEEYEMMMQTMKEMKDAPPEEVEKKKKEMMEKFGDRFKPPQQ